MWFQEFDQQGLKTDPSTSLVALGKLLCNGWLWPTISACWVSSILLPSLSVISHLGPSLFLRRFFINVPISIFYPSYIWLKVHRNFVKVTQTHLTCGYTPPHPPNIHYFTNIYWVTIMCQMLSQVLGIQLWKNRQNSCPDRAYALVGKETAKKRKK